MQNKIPYSTISQCKMGNEEALAAILKHYQPLIIESSMRTIVMPDGTTKMVVDEDIKAYIESELAMKILLKYDLTKKPDKKMSNTQKQNNKIYGLSG